MSSQYINQYEKEVIKEIKQFAQDNDIPFSKMTELMILNTIRTVKQHCKNEYMAKHGDKIQLLKNLRNPQNP